MEEVTIMNTNTEKSVKEFIKEQDERNDNVEKLITGKNQHSVYHFCIKHGFGIHMPMDNRCPSCNNETFLYISADDVLSLLSQAKREEWEKIEKVFDQFRSSNQKVKGKRWFGVANFKIGARDLYEHLKSHLINKKDTKEKVEGE